MKKKSTLSKSTNNSLIYSGMKKGDIINCISNNNNYNDYSCDSNYIIT